MVVSVSYQNESSRWVGSSRSLCSYKIERDIAGFQSWLGDNKFRFCDVPPLTFNFHQSDSGVAGGNGERAKDPAGYH